MGCGWRARQGTGISTAVIEVCRLLDGGPLRDALKHSDPDVTFAVFLLSAELFGTYVEGGRTALRGSQFTEVEVKVKQFARPAYLYVPVPSGGQEPPAEPLGDDSTPVGSPPSGGPTLTGITINGDKSQNVFGNTAGRDLHVGRP